MKRKKLFRPLIDLPKNSESRKFYEKDFIAFNVIPGLPGCTGMGCHNEALAVAMIKQTYPSLLEVAHPKDKVSIYTYDLTSNGEAASAVAYHSPLQDDDPDHLECGWAFNIVKGPLSMKTKIREKADEVAKAIYEGRPFINGPAG